MGIVQNGYDQHGNAQDDLEFPICTHKASLPSKTQGGNRSRSTGCPGKYIILLRCGPAVGQGLGEGSSKCTEFGAFGKIKLLLVVRGT